MPPSGVIAVSTASFGTTIKGGHTPPLNIANSVLSKPPTDIDPPQLPTYTALTGKIGKDIIREQPKPDLIAAQTRVGAATRQTGQALDKELRTTRVFGGRQPVQGDPGGVRTNGSGDTRPTGAVVRPPVVTQASDPPVKQATRILAAGAKRSGTDDCQAAAVPAAGPERSAGQTAEL